MCRNETIKKKGSKIPVMAKKYESRRYLTDTSEKGTSCAERVGFVFELKSSESSHATDTQLNPSLTQSQSFQVSSKPHYMPISSTFTSLRLLRVRSLNYLHKKVLRYENEKFNVLFIYTKMNFSIFRKASCFINFIEVS